MSSKRDGNGNKPFHQSSLLRYTKAKPRKSAPAPAAAPSVGASSSLKGGSPFASEVEFVFKSSGKRTQRAPNAEPQPATHPSTSGSTWNGTTREVKENWAPSTAASGPRVYSSPIPGLSMGRERSLGQMEEAKMGTEPVDSVFLGSKGHSSKRKARELAVDEPTEMGDRERTKRRRRTSSSSSSMSTSLPLASLPVGRKPGSFGTLPPTPRKSSPTNQQQERSPFRRLFDDAELDIDAGSGSIVDSSQTQALLTPIRPGFQSPSTSPPQAGDGIVVGSSQTPSPLRILSQPPCTFPSSPSKAGQSSIKDSPPPLPEGPVRRRRRVPDGATSLFGVAQDFKFDFESLSDLIPKSNVKRTRRPGRYSVPLQPTNEEATALNRGPRACSTKSSPFHSSTHPPSTAVEPSEGLRFSLKEHGGTSMHELTTETPSSDPGPFWETQPLIDVDLDTSRSASQFLPVSPPPPSRFPSQLTRVSSTPHSHASHEEPPRPTPAPSLHIGGVSNDSGSETEQDSPIPPHSLKRPGNSSADPDRTVVALSSTRRGKGNQLGSGAFSSSRRHSRVAGTSLVPNSSPTIASEVEDDWDGDGEKTMVDRSKGVLHNVGGRGDKREDVELSRITRGMESLSPFKRSEKRRVATEKETQQTLRLHAGEVIFIEDESECDVGTQASHHSLPYVEEETQESQTYTQLWPGTSLPGGWKTSFETPKKERRRPNPPHTTSVTVSFSAASYNVSNSEGHSSDDGLGLDGTPRTMEREYPVAARAFEAQLPSFPGMFAGVAAGESESESELEH